MAVRNLPTIRTTLLLGRFPTAGVAEPGRTRDHLGMPLDLDDARRLLDVPPTMSDDDLLEALVLYATAADSDMEPAEVTQRVRTFVDALNASRP